MNVGAYFLARFSRAKDPYDRDLWLCIPQQFSMAYGEFWIEVGGRGLIVVNTIEAYMEWLHVKGC